MNIKRIREILRERIRKSTTAAAATRLSERRAWLRGRVHGMSLALKLIETREIEMEAARQQLET